MPTRAELHAAKKSLPWAVKRCSRWKQTLEAIFKCLKMHYSNFKSPASLRSDIVTGCCCAVLCYARTFRCKNPVSWAEQKLSGALVLQWLGDWAPEQHKVCLTSSPVGRDWNNIRSRLCWPVGNPRCCGGFFFSQRLPNPLMVQFYPNREKEEGEGDVMADGNPQGGENRMLHFGTWWQGQLYSNLVCL